MQGQTTITYGEVLITNCVTERFSQEAVYTPDGSHLIYHKFNVEVSGYCSGEQRHFGSMSSPIRENSFIAGGAAVMPNINLPDPTRQSVWIRSHLEKPRLRFQMRTGVRHDAIAALIFDPTTSAAPNVEGAADDGRGSILLDALPYLGNTASASEWPKASPSIAGPGTGGQPNNLRRGDGSGYDLNNGPKCLKFDITKIVGNDLFLVRAAFEVFKLECGTGDGRAEAVTKGVLSNRWSMEDDLDGNLRTTRRFQGQIRITTPYLEPNAFRGWVVPALQPGFRRDSMKFQVTEDGLQLAYVIIDKEIAFSAPQPATSWSYKHTETVVSQTMIQTTVDVRLSGHRDTPKTQLFRTAAAIAHAKTDFLTVPWPVGNILHDVTCVDEYGDSENSISLHVVVSRPKKTAEFAGVNPFLMGVPIKAIDFMAMVNGAPLQPLAANYDRNKSRGSYVGDAVELEGKLPALGCFAAYLISTCTNDHDFTDANNMKDLPTFSNQHISDNKYTLSAEVVTALPTNPVTYLNSTAVSADRKESDFPYTHWQCESTIKENKTRVQLPIAGQASYFLTGSNQATSAIVALGGSVVTRCVRFKGTRIGRPPTLPAGADKIPYSPGMSNSVPNRDATLMDFRLRPHVTDRTVDGQEIHTVEGDFTYAIPVSVVAATGVMMRIFTGWNPWEDQTLALGIPKAKKATEIDLFLTTVTP